VPDVSLAALAAQVFTGLVLGMIFVLLAIGLSLIFGLMTVVNFSHGALYMLGAYVGFTLLRLTGSFAAALVLAPLLVGTLGLLIERFLIRRLYGRGPDDPLLLTFGLSLVVVETARLIWGKIGLTLDPPRALALGLDVGRIWFLVFGIGAGLAGLAGILAGPMRGAYAEMGVTIIIESFVVVVVGGMGSLLGAVVSGLVIGQIVSLTTFFAPKLAEIVVFITMAIVLLVRPSGLFGEAGLAE